MTKFENLNNIWQTERRTKIMTINAKLTPISVQYSSFCIATIMSPHFDGLLRITEVETERERYVLPITTTKIFFGGGQNSFLLCVTSSSPNYYVLLPTPGHRKNECWLDNWQTDVTCGNAQYDPNHLRVGKSYRVF